MSAFMFPSFFFNFRACNLFVCVVRTEEEEVQGVAVGVEEVEKKHFFLLLFVFWLLLHFYLVFSPLFFIHTYIYISGLILCPLSP